MVKSDLYIKLLVFRFVLTILVLASIIKCTYGQQCQDLIIPKDVITKWHEELGLDYILKKIDSVNNIIQGRCGVVREQAINRSHLSSLFLQNGRVTDAINLNKSLVKEFLNFKDSLNYLISLDDLGNSYVWYGDNGAALETQSLAYSKMKEYGIEVENIETRYLQSLAQQHYSTNLDSTRYYLYKAAEISMKAKNYRQALVATTNLAYSYSNHGQDSKALQIVKKIEEEILPFSKDPMVASVVYRGLAKMNGKLQNTAQSIRYFNLAEQAFRESSDEELLLSIISYERATTYKNSGQLEKARFYSDQGFERLGFENWNQNLLKMHPNLQYVLSSLKVRSGIIEKNLEMKDNVHMRIELDEVYQRTIETIQILLESFEVKRGTEVLEGNTWVYDKAIENCYHIFDKFGLEKYKIQGLWYSERNKAQLLKLKQRHDYNFSLLDKEIKDKRDALTSLIRGYKLEYYKKIKRKDYLQSSNVMADLLEAQRAVEEIDKMYLQKEDGRGQSYCFTEIQDLNTIQSQFFKEGEMSLHVYETDSIWNIWYISSDTLMMKRYAAPIGLNDDRDCSLDLEGDLALDISTLAERGTRYLTFISNGDLSRCAIESSSICGDNEIILDYYTISYSYSLCPVVGEVDGFPKTYKTHWLGWAPEYKELRTTDSTDAQIAELVRSGQYHLPGAIDEVKAIDKLINGKSLIAQQATKKSFFENSGSAKVIHLSMHAILDYTESNLSKFVFVDEDEKSEGENYLHAFELEELNLNAELAVLSACETGLGDVEAGEGAMSLARSFAFAGVPATVMSLWKVPDESTSKIMISFYKYLKIGLRKDESLRMAKREYLENTISEKQRKPFYWAGFVLVGDSNPILFSQPKSYNSLLGGVLIVVLVVATIFNRAKRKIDITS